MAPKGGVGVSIGDRELHKTPNGSRGGGVGVSIGDKELHKTPNGSQGGLGSP